MKSLKSQLTLLKSIIALNGWWQRRRNHKHQRYDWRI